MKRISRILVGTISGVLLVIGLSLLLQSQTAAAQSTSARRQVIQNGLAYLKAQQQADGGILGFSGVSDPDTTARAVLAFIMADPPLTNTVAPEVTGMLRYLSTQAISFTHDVTGTLFPGRAGVLLAAVSQAGENTSDFGGMDLVREIEDSFHPDTGAYSSTAKQDFSSGEASDLNQAWALLGLSLSGQPIQDSALQYLYQSQAQDGSWGSGDPDTTALAVTAILSFGGVAPQEPAIQNALQFFHATQLDNGGWKPTWDQDLLNADSTGWILQALASAGEDSTGADWTAKQGNPVDALLGLQKADGSIGGTYANAYSTAEAIIGLSGASLRYPISLLQKTSVGLAVFPGDGTVITACLTINGKNIDGLALLQNSGLTSETATNPTQGTAVCKIQQVGCPASDCFCKMPNYWSFWQASDAGWVYSSQGAMQTLAANGDVQAWSWGSGDPPPAITFANICENAPFAMPEVTQTSLPPTNTPPPTQAATLTLAATSTQLPAQAESSPFTPGTYIVYGLIVVVLIALAAAILNARKKRG
jgi:hypothetical protein